MAGFARKTCGLYAGIQGEYQIHVEGCEPGFHTAGTEYVPVLKGVCPQGEKTEIRRQGPGYRRYGKSPLEMPKTPDKV
jgi:hypothetical protein